VVKANPSLTIDGRSGAEDEVFFPHGRLTVRLESSVVRIDAEGPFNAELFDAFRRLVPPIYRQAAAVGRYVVIVRATRSVMMSMEAIGELGRSVKTFHESGFGPVASIYVADSTVEGRDLMLPLLERQVYQPASVPFMWFDTEAEALACAQRCLTAAGAVSPAPTFRP
jgi:hypothetical protein